jgi:hypothetical protein
MAHVGRRAIYRENGLLLPFTVSRIHIGRKWLEIQLHPKNSPLPNSSKKSFTVGTSWSDFQVSPGWWRGGYTWRVDFREEPYHAVLRVCIANGGLPPEKLFTLCAAAFQEAELNA